MKAFPDLQKNTVRTHSVNWAGWLASGVTVSSVTVAEASNDTGITFGTPAVSGDETSVEITAVNTGSYLVVFGATLSNGEVEYRTFKQKVVDYRS